MSDYLLPEEILIEILVKLPVKSLICGTSVCKQWGCLIRSPSFISTHLSNTSQNQALLRRYDNKKHQDHYTVIPKRGPFLINSDSKKEFEYRMWFFRIMGSCDGLVCLSDDYSPLEPNPERIIIWNPAIRNHVDLPQPHLVNPYNAFVGFGVANNVYKVVRLVLGFIVPPQAEIFCLGTRRWRELTGFDVRGLVPQYYPGRPIFFEGLVHWVAYDPISEDNIRSSILTFHVGDEVFGETMLPQELERVALVRSLSLAVMGESLGAINYDMSNERCDVWMMKDYGVKESWTKLYMIALKDFDRVIGFWGSGEALVLVHGHELATYNPATKGVKRVGVSGYISSFYVNDYKESLVLLGGYSGDTGEGLN